jgi:hypothetical protein
MLTTKELFELAIHHASEKPDDDSTWFCIDDAEMAQEQGRDQKIVRRWLLRSLEYSIGVLHPDYIRAKG